MSKFYFAAIFILLLSPCSFAQTNTNCHDGRIIRGLNKGTILSPLENQYDVQYVKLDLQMDNTNTSIRGNATTIAKVIEPAGMSQYAFELNDNMTVDSIKFNGLPATATTISTHLKAITPPALLAVNTTFTAQVFYHGTAQNGTGFFTGGIIHSTLASGTQTTFSLSDDYFAKDWWPCKQSLLDKIDSADLWITVPPNTKAGCNGLLKQITPVTGGNRYEWKTRYPIAYYLLCASVAPYADYTTMVHFTGSTDSMPVQNYVYDTTALMPVYRGALDTTALIVDHFSTLFGRYPYWKEKYGHCTAPLGGGMEHQTMTTLGPVQTPLIAHELGHQWWGDCVTYGSWRDIWLSEGWASYCEQLYIEHYWGTAAAKNYRTSVFNRVMAQLGGFLYVDDTTNVFHTFDSRLTYDKGAAVAHMLRFIAPNDAVYFQALRNYQQLYAYKTAVTTDFKAVMEQAYGTNLDTFFNQWIFGEGYPTYKAKWNQAGNTVFVQLDQTTSKPASVAVFHTPLEIKLSSPLGDTIVKVYSAAAQQTFSFTWDKTMSGLTIDPDNQVVNKTGTITKDPTLDITRITRNDLRIYPNPTRDTWQVSNIPPHTWLQLHHTNGQLIWQQKDASGDITIPATSLPAGQYELSSYGAGQKISSWKLIKW